MGNGCETLYKPEKLLLRGLVDGCADSGFYRKKWTGKQISDGTKPNFEPIPLLGGKGPGGVTQTKTTHGIGRGTLYAGARCYGGGIQKGAERNLRGVPVII